MKKRIRSILLIGAIICFLAALIVPNLTGQQGGYQGISASGKIEEPPFTKHGTLTFWVSNTDSARATFDIEIAQDNYHRSMGLMHRRSMSPEQGMLFVFDTPQPLSFWMKNTHIPLDMVFVSSDLRVVNFHQNTTPLVEQHYKSTALAQYCIELNAWTTRTYNIQPSDSVSWERSAPAS